MINLKLKEEEKVLYTLAISLFLLLMIYYVGKEIGTFIKRHNQEQTSIEKII